MLTAAPRLLVTGRSAPTAPAPYGLLSVVEDAPSSDAHWVNGLEWDHAACSAVTGIAGVCADELSFAVERSLNSTATADPFTLVAAHVCNPVGLDVDRASQLAREALARHEQEAIEAIISSGSLSTSPTFLGATDLTPGASGVGIPRALGILADHAAATYGVAGSVIHAPRTIAGFLTAPGPASDDPLTIVTGERLSLGAGYANLDPSGNPAADNVAWLYVTPPVLFKASETMTIPPDASAAYDRTVNTLEAIAERTYVVGWDDCPLGAVAVDLTNPY